MLSALRRMFRPRAGELKKLPDCEPAPNDHEECGECSEGFEESDRATQVSRATQRLKKWTNFFGRGDGARNRSMDKSRNAESDFVTQPLTTFGQTSSDSSQEGNSCGFDAGIGKLSNNEYNNTASGSSSCSENSSSRRTRGDCSRSNCSSNSSCHTCTSCVYKASNCTAEANTYLHKKGDGDQQQDQLVTSASGYPDEDEDDDTVEEDDDDDIELDDGPVTFIAEPPPKQQQHSYNARLQQQQQNSSDRMSCRSVSVGQLATKQPATYSQNKTDVDQLLTGSTSQQQRKDIVRGNLEELRVAESVNFRSVVYKYSFRIPDNFATMRIFTDPDDRRIEAIARSCDTQIRLERPRPNGNGLARTRTVTIQAPDLHSLEKCCRQFDDRFPQFYVTGGLGQSSKSIKRVYVDDLDSPT